MADETEDKFPITLSVPEQGFKRKFRNRESWEKFLSDEFEFWSGINASANNASNGSPVFPDWRERITLSPLNQALNDLHNPDATIPELLQKYIFKEGTWGRAISEVEARAPYLLPGAIVHFGSFVRGDAGLNVAATTSRANLGQVVSLVGAQALIAELMKKKAPETARFQEAINEWQGIRDEIDTTYAQLSTNAAQYQEDSAKQLDDFDTHAKSLLQETTKQFGDFLATSQSTILDLEDKTRNRLVLEAPTTYWTTKATRHQRVAWVFGIIFVLTLSAGIYWLTHSGVQLVADAHRQIVGDRQDIGLLALVPLAFVTMPSLALAWLLRHVSRVIVQNIALAADASLRGTIATTYSALTIDRETSQAELAIALQALFRPVDGSDHAEISPPNLQEIIELSSPRRR